PPAKGDPAAKGPEGAAVTLVEFSDFQCPWCSRIAPTIDEVRATYGDAVRIEFRHFPLDQIHPQARKASEVAYCAQQQGKFWEMHDDLFAHQKALDLEQIKERAGGLGLGLAELESCLDSGRAAEAVAADVEAGLEAGVSATPSLFVNGRPVRLTGGTPPIQQLSAVIDDELARQGKS
ncbi:MAG: DsbA family protein, partial [Acidobacteria bacterium]|nr:DsbA family protein [Acidobacteriota bacterium]